MANDYTKSQRYLDTKSVAYRLAMDSLRMSAEARKTLIEWANKSTGDTKPQEVKLVFLPQDQLAAEIFKGLWIDYLRAEGILAPDISDEFIKEILG